jgi:glycosyltransferase involved in cell wall biosynthesis
VVRSARAFASIASVRHLFIAGCPRSGTSALTFLLNEHPQLAIGFERYKRLRAQLDPFHFKPQQFFSPVTAETDIRGQLLYERLRARWEGGSVRLIGDKVPLYTRVLPQLIERFPGACVLVLVRDPLDVARSFRRRAADPADWWPAENDHTLAVAMWNEALAAVREVEVREVDSQGEEVLKRTPGGGPEGVALLPYEALFSGDPRWLEMLVDFLEVPLTTRLSVEHQRLAARWQERGSGELMGEGGQARDEELRDYVASHCDAELARWAQARMERQLAQAGSPLAPGAGEDEPALSDEEIAGRELERAALLAEMRRPGRPGEDELELLTRRYLQQAGELARRGELLGSPAGARLRITFLSPHQRAASGGVYVIEQFARHLAARGHHVCLAVRRRPVRSIPGVEVRWAEGLDAHTLPPADVLVYPADMPDAALLAELPRALGRQVLFFQGYGTPGSPVVEANLARAREAIAIARWLSDLALARGIACAYVPQGLDRQLFAPGPPQAERAARVTVMAHHLDWKGLQDALAALALVRQQRPHLPVTFFAGQPLAEGAELEALGVFLAGPSRSQVAALLRASAVHLVSSWEEGFGLIGAEAIACGAALATTDTKGSRDYAIHRHTALVSPPRDPSALAHSVLELLGDVELRARLAAVGQRHLRSAMVPWDEAARRMALALGEG